MAERYGEGSTLKVLAKLTITDNSEMIVSVVAPSDPLAKKP